MKKEIYLYSFYTYREVVGPELVPVKQYMLVYADDVFDALSRLKKMLPHVNHNSFCNQTIL